MGCGGGKGSNAFNETILHLNFINDLHEIDKEEAQSLLKIYDELGRKINKFVQYVENEWI